MSRVPRRLDHERNPGPTTLDLNPTPRVEDATRQAQHRQLHTPLWAAAPKQASCWPMLPKTTHLMLRSSPVWMHDMQKQGSTAASTPGSIPPAQPLHAIKHI